MIEGVRGPAREAHFFQGQTVKLVNIVRKGEEQMSAEKITDNAVDPDGKWLYRVGGQVCVAPRCYMSADLQTTAKI